MTTPTFDINAAIQALREVKDLRGKRKKIGQAELFGDYQPTLQPQEFTFPCEIVEIPR